MWLVVGLSQWALLYRNPSLMFSRHYQFCCTEFIMKILKNKYNKGPLFVSNCTLPAMFTHNILITIPFLKHQLEPKRRYLVYRILYFCGRPCLKSYVVLYPLSWHYQLQLNYWGYCGEFYTFCRVSHAPCEAWCNFLQLLQSLQLCLFSFSHWQVSILSHSDLCLPCNKEGGCGVTAIEHVRGRNGILWRAQYRAFFKYFQNSLTDIFELCFYTIARQEV